MSGLAAHRMVKSRMLRDADDRRFFIAIDLTPEDAGEYRIATVYEDNVAVEKDVEHCDSLESACFVLGSRVRRELNGMLRRARRAA